MSLSTSRKHPSRGGNITFKGTLVGDDYFTARLFQGEIVFGDSPAYFTYSVKSDGSSLVGLALEFISAVGEKRSVLLASHGNALLTMNRFSSHFSSVVMPRRVTNLEEAPGWVLQESGTVMDGYTLTEIRAVGYMGNPSVNSSQLEFDGQHQPTSLAQSEYYAVLGHLNIYTPPPPNSDRPPCFPVVTNFPPSTSWIVGGKYIKWNWGSQGSKKLSIKLTWQLKDGSNSLFPKYNIYVQKLVDPKLSNGMSMEKAEYSSRRGSFLRF